MLGTRTDHGADLGVYFVATDPASPGVAAGSTRLLAAALIAARERGCATSSLQSSARGKPVYEALGYVEQVRPPPLRAPPLRRVR